MKNLLVAWAAFLAVSCSMSSPADPGAIRRDSTPLLGAFRSYQTVDAVRAESGNAKWTVSEDTRVAARGGCPRFDNLTMTAPWADLGHSGDLELSFVNGVLYESRFYPEEPSGYLEMLAQAGHRFEQRDAVGAPTEKLPPRTRLWHWHRYDDRRYVGWCDEAIEDEIRAWVFSCS